MVEVANVDPQAWADALISLMTRGGIAVAILLVIFWLIKYKPWFRSR